MTGLIGRIWKHREVCKVTGTNPPNKHIHNN